MLAFFICLFDIWNKEEGERKTEANHANLNPIYYSPLSKGHYDTTNAWSYTFDVSLRFSFTCLSFADLSLAR